MNSEVKSEPGLLSALAIALLYAGGAIFLRMAYVFAIIVMALILVPVFVAAAFAALVGLLSALT